MLVDELLLDALIVTVDVLDELLLTVFDEELLLTVMLLVELSELVDRLDSLLLDRLLLDSVLLLALLAVTLDVLELLSDDTVFVLLLDDEELTVLELLWLDELLLALMDWLLLDVLWLEAVVAVDGELLLWVLSELADRLWVSDDVLLLLLSLRVLVLLLDRVLADELLLLTEEKLDADSVEKLLELSVLVLLDDTEMLDVLRLLSVLLDSELVLRLLRLLSLISSAASRRRSCPATDMPALALLMYWWMALLVGNWMTAPRLAPVRSVSTSTASTSMLSARVMSTVSTVPAWVLVVRWSLNTPWIAARRVSTREARCEPPLPK